MWVNMKSREVSGEVKTFWKDSFGEGQVDLKMFVNGILGKKI